MFLSAAFYAAIDRVRSQRGLLWKDVADQSGISPSTFVRLGQGKQPDVATFAKLISWADLEANMFFTNGAALGSTLPILIATIHRDPELPAGAKQVMELLISVAYQVASRWPK